MLHFSDALPRAHAALSGSPTFDLSSLVPVIGETMLAIYLLVVVAFALKGVCTPSGDRSVERKNNP